MLFNSYLFIIIFLPTVFFVFFALGKSRRGLALTWLVLASLFFYAWWSPKYLFLILMSMVINYYIGGKIQFFKSTNKSRSKLILTAGIIFNLSLIFFYKYINLLIGGASLVLNRNFTPLEIALPLAISFFTFQQIAYLVDIYQGKATTPSWLHYSLFITFFPQLIAGPIVHSGEIMPQFENRRIFSPQVKNIAIGVTIFFIGLFKKVGIADQISPVANEVFHLAKIGVTLTFWEAWGGATAYAFQLYFDFSGYSEMAIGLAKMFNIYLPINFNSPYRAVSIIDFWRRWHITLSRFLRDYLYIPLGGNQKGEFRRYLNLMVTMLLGGLWHGAGLNFLLWGGLHGFYLAVNNLWRKVVPIKEIPSTTYTIACRLVTFLVVIWAWVLFRADTLDAAKTLYRSMLGLKGIQFPQRLGTMLPPMPLFNFEGMFHHQIFNGPLLGTTLLVLLALCWYGPNTLGMMIRYPSAFNFNRDEVCPSEKIYWQPTATWAVFLAAMSMLCLAFLSQPSEFLYYRF